jgi:hypothetical protein
MYYYCPNHYIDAHRATSFQTLTNDEKISFTQDYELEITPHSPTFRNVISYSTFPSFSIQKDIQWLTLVNDQRIKLSYRNGLYACGYAAADAADPTENCAAAAAGGTSCEMNTELPVAVVNPDAGDVDKTNGDITELGATAGPV